MYTTTAFKRFERIAQLMDSSLALGKGGYRIGIDPLIGLLPIVGDFAGLLISSYTVWLSAQAGASRILLVRMMFNIGIETVIGAIPIVGDLFDFTFKANKRNFFLLEKELRAGKLQQNIFSDKKLKQSLLIFLIGGFSVVIAFVIGTIMLLMNIGSQLL